MTDAILNAVFPVFALILLGAVVERRKLLGEQAIDVLNRFVVYLALPALLFHSLATMEWSQLTNYAFLASFGGGMIITFVLSFVIDWKSGVNLSDRSIESLAASYANTGFMGIPLCLIALGSESLPAAALATCLTTFPLFASAIVVIEIDQHAHGSWTNRFRKVGGALVKNPLLISSTAGFAWAAVGLGMPNPIDRVTSLLGNAASPCALVLIGMLLAETQGASNVVTVGRIVGLKLFVQPAVTAALAFFVFPMTTIWLHSAILLSALPIGTGPVMLAKLYGREAGVSSRSILVSTVASVVTIAVLLTWFESR